MALDYFGYVNRYSDLREYARSNGLRSPQQLRVLGEQHYNDFGRAENRTIGNVEPVAQIAVPISEPATRVVESPKTTTEKPAVSLVRDTVTGGRLDTVKKFIDDVNPSLFITFLGLASMMIMRG